MQAAEFMVMVVRLIHSNVRMTEIPTPWQAMKLVETHAEHTSQETESHPKRHCEIYHSSRKHFTVLRKRNSR